MFIVGQSFFSETLSKFNIKTIAPLFIIQKMCTCLSQEDIYRLKKIFLVKISYFLIFGDVFGDMDTWE